MKTWKKVLLTVLVILLAAAGGIYLWQRENIHALYKVMTTDSQTIVQDLEQIRNDHLKELEEAAQVRIEVKPVTPQQSEDLLDGKVTPEQVKEQMGLLPETAQPAANANDILNRCVAELYAYKADVMGYLGGVKQSVLSQWQALDPSQRTKTKKIELAMGGLRQCYEYEVTVDGRVKEILAKYRPQMVAIGADPTPIDLLWNQYCGEKEAEKSYYMDKYMD